jgi:adenylate cyclase
MERDEANVHTFLFADLAGFTALTEAHGDEQAADLVLEFSEAVKGLLVEYRAEQVKTIGDAVMMRAAHADHAVELALDVVNEVGSRHGFPIIRAGMHSGPAVERAGDWFGATVNVAARVSGAASGGEVLLTEDTRRLSGEIENVRFHDRGRRSFRNVGAPLRLYSATWHSEWTTPGLAIDPVCRMAVDEASGSGTLIYEDVEYHFCSLECAGKFAAAPERYVEARDDRV